MFNFNKFRPELSERAKTVYEAIQKDCGLMSHIRWAEKNRKFECGNIRINNYQTAIDAAVDEKAEELGIKLSTMEKLNIGTNFVCDFGSKNGSR